MHVCVRVCLDAYTLSDLSHAHHHNKNAQTKQTTGPEDRLRIARARNALLLLDQVC